MPIARGFKHRTLTCTLLPLGLPVSPCTIISHQGETRTGPWAGSVVETDMAQLEQGCCRTLTLDW
jgi:hypothetical protein